MINILTDVGTQCFVSSVVQPMKHSLVPVIVHGSNIRIHNILKAIKSRNCMQTVECITVYRQLVSEALNPCS